MANFPSFFRVAFQNVDTSSTLLNAHLAAVIVKGGSVVSVGINRPKMNSYVHFYGNHENCGSVHAEIDAIFRARRKVDLRGSKMYVARLTKRGQVGLAMPCKMCRRALQRYGIKRVYYTVDENTHAEMRLRPVKTNWKKR